MCLFSSGKKRKEAAMSYVCQKASNLVLIVHGLYLLPDNVSSTECIMTFNSSVLSFHELTVQCSMISSQRLCHLWSSEWRLSLHAITFQLSKSVMTLFISRTCITEPRLNHRKLRLVCQQTAVLAPYTVVFVAVAST